MRLIIDANDLVPESEWVDASDLYMLIPITQGNTIADIISELKEQIKILRRL